MIGRKHTAKGSSKATREESWKLEEKILRRTQMTIGDKRDSHVLSVKVATIHCHGPFHWPPWVPPPSKKPRHELLTGHTQIGRQTRIRNRDLPIGRQPRSISGE